MARDRLLTVPISVALHTKLKWRAKKEDRSMASIVRSLVEGYLSGETEVSKPGDEPDFYDHLYEKVSSAVDS